ncbi:LytR/AlgR family response regulator transcription factor [Flavivirga eckloniae]|nr:LytTR family DNA-binding domain-containing protein [Flavivirga eckloniae]
MEKKDKELVLSSDNKTGLIGIPDENGVVKLSLVFSNILYIESADNYISVHYVDNEKTKHILIRNTLKTIESIFENTSLKRCHRSYMINLDKIKMAQKKSGRLYLHIKNTETIIPVSRNYTTAFQSIISSIPK